MTLKIEPSSSRNGPPFVYWSLLWWLGAVVAIYLLFFDLTKPNMTRLPGRDFTNLWTAGRLALDGDAWKAFNVDTFRLALLNKAGILSLQNYSYPPHALFIAAPFALMPYYLSLAVWTVLGFVFFVWAARPFIPFHPLLAALTPAAAFNIWNGHYGFYIGGLWLLVFYWVRNRPYWAAVAAGLLSFKPHLGLLIAIRLLTERRALVATVLTVVLLVAASAFIFGAGTWAAFLTDTTAEQADILTAPGASLYLRMMPSAYCVFGGGSVGILAQLIFASASIGILIYRSALNPFSAATATFLIVPYTFNYDMTVACLGFAILIYSRWSVLSWHAKALLTLAFWAPELTWIVPWLVPPILLAGLWLQTSPGLNICVFSDGGGKIKHVAPMLGEGDSVAFNSR